jgi:hypothetical protein
MKAKSMLPRILSVNKPGKVWLASQESCMKFAGPLASALAVVLATATLADAAPLSRSPFDGRWSVEVITDRGTCDRAYRWSIGIDGGRVTDIGGNVARASGGIDRRGRVDVTLTRNSDVLTARGAASGNWGQGTWVAPSKQCSGIWRAERRSSDYRTILPE